MLILLIAVASIAGSLIEQETLYQDWRPPKLYYPDRYGAFWGNLFLRLGLTHTYSSVWYATLILLVVVSLIICSFHRLVPLHRALTRPQVWKLAPFIRRQEVSHEVEGNLEEAATLLRKRGYKVVRDRECLYADKGRLSRYGPYIIHIGLLIVAFAGFSRALPGWDETRDVWIADGQTVKVPETEFALTNHKFTLEFHPNGAPAHFATDASLLKNGEEVARTSIEVNHPLRYDGWRFYQTSWREEPGTARLKVMAAPPLEQHLLTLELDLRQPEAVYPIGDRFELHVLSYYHDFVVDPATGEPGNASFEIRNPVLLGDFYDRQTGQVIGKIALAVFAKEPPVYQGPFYLAVDTVEPRLFTALKLHKDRSIPYMFTGLSVVMTGMMITFFVFHWQVWVREENGVLVYGARAYKNRFGLRQEFRRLLGIPDGEGNVS